MPQGYHKAIPPASPGGSQAILRAFDLNVKASGANTRDAKGPSFIQGVNNRKLHTVGEVEEATEMAHFNDHQKKLIREGPCGIKWIVKIYKESAGSSSLISPLDQPSVKEKLTKYTGYCLNTGHGLGMRCGLGGM